VGATIRFRTVDEDECARLAQDEDGGLVREDG